MRQYKLKYIPGTWEFVVQELTKKLENYQIDTKRDKEVIISLDVEDIYDLRVLRAPLHISQLENESMAIDNSQRDWRVEKYGSGGINPSLAYMLCQAAAINPGNTIYDPFCGSGVIPITAKLNFETGKIFASDVSGNAIDMSQKNFNAAQIRKHEYVLFRSNIKMVKLQEDSIDRVITNMPFGIRRSNHKRNMDIYKNFIQKLTGWLTDSGIAIALTAEKQLMFDICSKYDLKCVELTQIQQGGLRPSIFKITSKTS